MIGTLMGFWRAHKSRARVVAALRPYMDGWRRDGGSDADLVTPAALGFLTTLITALAEREAGALQSDALGALQAGAWQQLTGLPADGLGQRIVALSIAADPGFVRGCDAALRFAAIHAAATEAGDDGLGAAGGNSAAAPGVLRAALHIDLGARWTHAIRGEAPEVDCPEFPDTVLGIF